MKKIVVSTFNNSKNNYGGVFQACALSKTLHDMHYDAKFITLENRKIPQKTLLGKGKDIVRKIIKLPYKRKIKIKEESFQKFAKKTQNQLVFRDIRQLNENPPIVDVYISGSDQVWNAVSFHEDLFLSYAPENGKKISYAASMGNERVPVQNKEKFTHYISRFDCISVREDTMVDLLKEYTDKSICQNIDPVFLMDKEDWLEWATPYKKLKFEKYILAYIIEWNAEYNKKLKMIKKQTGLPVVFVNLGNLKRVSANQVIHDASPNEFLGLLNGAEIIVATSFHGVAMSCVFNKPVMPMIGMDKPTRIQSLLRHFGLSCEELLNNNGQGIDYQRVNAIIDDDKQKAKEYLYNAIEG